MGAAGRGVGRGVVAAAPLPAPAVRGGAQEEKWGASSSKRMMTSGNRCGIIKMAGRGRRVVDP